MKEFHPKHRSLIVVDDTDRTLNRAVAMKHALFQRAGSRNMKFPAIVEYPFFTKSELSNGIQLADLPAYNVHHAFKDRNLGHSYFDRMPGNFHCRLHGTALDGLKVRPPRSPLFALATKAWNSCQRKSLGAESR